MHGEVWTPETDALITQLRFVERLTLRDVAARVGRSMAATSLRLRKLGVTIHERREWNDEEVASLRAALADADRTIRSVASDLGRSEFSVRWKMEDLGLRLERVRVWTAEEDARLLAATSADAIQGLSREIGRSVESMKVRLRFLGVRRRKGWTPDLDSTLEALVAAGGSVKSISLAMGRSPSSVSVRARKLELAFAAEPQAWLECEEACLREIAGEMGVGPGAVAVMAKRTGRSARAVKARLKSLGLTGMRARKPVSVPAKRPLAVRTTVRLPAVPLTGNGAARSTPVRTIEAPRVVRREAEKPKLSADLEDAIARFVREKGVTTAISLDPERETVRLVRARGYAVTGSGKDGFLVDGRLRLAGLAALSDFALKRGIPVPSETVGRD